MSKAAILALLALAAVVTIAQAGEYEAYDKYDKYEKKDKYDSYEPEADYGYGYSHGKEHKEHKVIRMWIKERVAATSDADDRMALRGNTEYIQRTLTDEESKLESGDNPTGDLDGFYDQTGIVSRPYSNTTVPFATVLNWQVTIELLATKHHPAGKLFAVGDGTGTADPKVYPKEIVGGTGPYAGARGKLERIPEGPYVMTIWNW